MSSCFCEKYAIALFLIGAFFIGVLLFFITGCSPTGKYDLFEENDIFTPVNTDNQYTQGTLFKYTDGDTAYYGGQQIYTPKNKFTTELVKDDRPYAGWLYGGREKRTPNTPTSQTIESISVGVVGPASLGREAQNGVHKAIGDRLAEGWRNQIDNEPGVIYRVERQNLSLEDKVYGLETDNLSSYGVNLGNIKTDLFVSNHLRFGENLPSSFGYTTIPKVGKLPERLKPNYNMYGFLGVEGKLVGRDIFLDGNTFSSSHSVHKEWMVGELRLGVSVKLFHLRITYTLAVTTPEFRERPQNHSYGSLNFNYDKGD